MDNVKEKIYELVVSIPAGKVATYGQIAQIACCSPRYVGYALHHNPDPERIPCHRVINSRGETAESFAFGGAGIQQKMLEKEGIKFIDNRINLKIYRHLF